MSRYAVTIGLALLSLSVFGRDNAVDVLKTVADIRDAVFSPRSAMTPFDVSAQVLLAPLPSRRLITVMDSTGATEVDIEPIMKESVKESCRIGDVIHIAGNVRKIDKTFAAAQCDFLEVLAHGTAPLATNVTINTLRSGLCDHHPIKVSGTIVDAFRDEIDPFFMFFVVDDGSGIGYASAPIPKEKESKFKSLIGFRVTLEGLCVPCNEAYRRTLGRTIFLRDEQSILVLSDSKPDPFSAQDIPERSQLSPSEILQQGQMKTSGRVIALWHHDTALLRNQADQIIRLELQTSDLPRYGDHIEAVGCPETDLYRINLSRALWRHVEHTQLTNDAVQLVTAKRIHTDIFQRDCIEPAFHGKEIKLIGTVRSLPGLLDKDAKMHIQDGDYLVPVDVSANPTAVNGVEIGCTVEVSGTCVMDIENWRPNAVFPRIKGFMLVVRKPNDVRILARPPWLTTTRMMYILAALVLGIVAVLIWNLSLRILAERRGRALFKAQERSFEAKLKTEERTRMAVELHDSLAQNLSGVGMEIAAAIQSDEDGLEAVMHHLSIADKALQSCQDDLRNDLWDLRGQTFDEPDMAKAVDRTLQPVVRRGKVVIRFNVPRTRLSDNAAHNVLRIIRELVTNAVKHGQANTIHIAGCIDANRLLFSVSDDGCGFTVNECPGVREGHFGLSGIRMRLRKLGGNLALSSSLGKGTKATVEIPLPQDLKTKDLA